MIRDFIYFVSCFVLIQRLQEICVCVCVCMYMRVHLHVCVHAFSRASADKILWNGLRGREPAKLGRSGPGSHWAALALQPPADSDQYRAQARGETML